MGEENKGEENKEEKKEEKKEEEPKEIVLKVDMHCEACAKKVARSLRGFEGVEEVRADCKASKVVVKGKAADPIKVSERIQRKSRRKVEIVSPLPKPPQEEPSKGDQKKDQKEEDKKEEPPQPITVALQVRMHCAACAQVLRKGIRKIQGVESVETDIANGKVIVKGLVDPNGLVEHIYKRTRKQALIVKEEEKKEEEKKEEEKKEEEKKEGCEEGKEDDDKKTEVKKLEYWPTRYYMEYYAYPQIFSDENPNACSVM
ncbi:hypothetical protein Ancab_004760 [Ancistrocladus abbreviatus]